MPYPEQQVNAFSREDSLTVFQQARRTVVTTAATLTAAQTGTILAGNSLTGTLWTLPAATAANAGVTFELTVLLANTSGSLKVIGASSADLFVGSISMGVDATTPSATAGPKFFIAGASDYAIAMNGTTTGGLKGTNVRFVCLGLNAWAVSGNVAGSGTIATPFAAS